MRVSPQKVKIDNFCQRDKFALTMNPRKPQRIKSKSAGISLEPELVQQARVLAAQRGLNSLSALVRALLVRELGRPPNDLGKAQAPLASIAAIGSESALTPMLGDAGGGGKQKPRRPVRQSAARRL
jgi:hypothetical protein